MTTDLFTVKEDELVDLAALLMDWKGVRQGPVEDDWWKVRAALDVSAAPCCSYFGLQGLS